MSNITEQIKEKLDIVEFLKERIQLLPAGKNYRAICPFHKESNPSFMISPERQSWYCFGGCNEGGDIFKFLMKYENLEFYEALKVLAEKAGVELKTVAGGFGDYRQYGVLYEINEAAKNFFKSRLERSKPAQDYLVSRGLKKETVAEFELGLAPAGFDELTLDLVNLGFNINDIERAGLIIKNQRGSYQDRFRQRLMFPISSNFGKVVGFTGREIASVTSFPRNDEGDVIARSPQATKQSFNSNYIPAKYLNSPETPVFNKSRLLYGFHKTKSAIREKKEVLLVEGQMDFLMAYQDGVQNVVAVSGTALTSDHLKTMRRLADKLVLCFDSDEAGQLAAERTLDLAATADFSSKVLLLSDKDPAEVVQAQPGHLQQLINQAGSARQFIFQRYLKTSQDSAARKSAIRVILKKITDITSGIDRAEWLNDLSAKTAIAESVLVEEMGKLGHQAHSSGRPIPEPPPDAQQPISRKQLLAQRIVDLGGQCELARDPSGELMMKASLDNSFVPPEKKSEELAFLRRELEGEVFKEKQRALRQKIIQLEEAGDEPSLQNALREFDELNKKFHNI